MTNVKIQIGEYVRTNNGSIFKIIGGNSDDYLIDVDYHDLQKMEDDIYDELMWLNYNDNGNFISRIVKKHSFNLIDLIEAGDIVEITIFGEDTEAGATDPIGAIWHIRDKSMLHNIKQGCKLGTFELESILTREQFKSMEYKVGGEEYD